MLVINGQKYAPSASAFTESLFTSGGTCAGQYRKHKGGILLLDLQGKPFAFVVANRQDAPWIVTAFRQEDGRTRYMYGMSEHTERLLGLHTAEKRSTARHALDLDITRQMEEKTNG
jgi:hypothetical protein